MGEVEAHGSDGEDERKGGMQKKDIILWLWNINQYKNDFERNLDYPRYVEGEQEGHIIFEPESPRVPQPENGNQTKSSFRIPSFL